jgi:putative tryptophan/tyrosine transport system substrate-binding protein
VRRREFVAGLGSAAAWPLTARAQQIGRVRRIGVLMATAENDSAGNAFVTGFAQSLNGLGWTDGRGARMDFRWTGGSTNRLPDLAKELVDLEPDVILAMATPVTAALQGLTRTIPIVFVGVSDPVGDRFIASLSHPGGNLTGFIYVEAAMAGKWLELLMEIAPHIKRVASIFNPDTTSGRGSYFLPSFDAAARSLKVEPIIAPVHSDAEIETIITSLGREPGGGIITLADTFLLAHRASITRLTAQNNLPAVYYETGFARDGGLLCYGPDQVDMFRRAASYVDRILRGARPADLPVQVPTKFEFAINLKTAKALGLNVPQSLLLRADEVIE